MLVAFFNMTGEALEPLFENLDIYHDEIVQMFDDVFFQVVKSFIVEGCEVNIYRKNGVLRAEVSA